MPSMRGSVDRFYVWYVWKAIYGIILGMKVKEIEQVVGFLYLCYCIPIISCRVSLFNLSCT